ncbi:MAG: TonB-dependent receptor [Bacteroidaceae bacterium]|nr:TonB-dependent receptor [Bacteroidaceae bacterium]
MYSNTSIVSHNVATFKRFCRGGYAVFASLGREVRIGVLTVAMLGSVHLSKASAMIGNPDNRNQTESEEAVDDHELDAVTVAGSMAPLTQLQSARIVGVISRAQIEAAAVQTVNDLLKLAVGVDVRQRGGFGIQSDISIDGGTFDQITILLNGLNITNPHTGHLAADFPVSLSDIERIEVLEGAASRVYGASAFGGAINIVTRHDDKTNIQLGVHGGSYGTAGADARLGIQAGRLSTSLSGTWQRSDGATLNSDFNRGNAFLQCQYNNSDYNIHFQGGWSGKSYGANTFYSAAYPNQYERNDRFISSIGVESKGAVRLRPEVFWTRTFDNFELIRSTSTGENFHLTDVYGSRVGLDFSWVAGHTAVSGELREEGIYSTSLGLPLVECQYRRVGGEDATFYTRHDERTNISLSIEHNVLLPHWTISAGLLANMNTRFDSRFHLYPGIDVAFTPMASLRLFASYNKGFRLPTFTDLYYKSPTHEGNQGMKAEVSHSLQLGVRWQTSLYGGQLLTVAKGFYHRGSNLIDWVMYKADDVFHSANFDLDNMGTQAESRWQAQSSHSWVRSVSLGYTYIYQHRRDQTEIYKSNYAMEYLRHKFVATLDHRLVSRLTAAWSLRWQDRCGSYIKYENAVSTGQLVGYAPYATLDLKLRWTKPHYELWAEATNLTNHTYYDLGNIPQPGLVILAGVRCSF